MPSSTCLDSPASVSTLTSALRGLQKFANSRKTTWGFPVPWVATPIFAQGFAVAPAYGSANRLILCAYQVPRGYNALFCGIVAGYAGGGGGALPGQVIFTVDVDNPTAALNSPQQGYSEKDYGNVPFALGALSPGEPWPCEFKHDQGETIRVKGYTVSSVATGAGNFLYAALVGFQWPTMGWED